MKIKFISFFVKDEGKKTGFVIDNHVYDITKLIGEDLINIIKDGRINNFDFLSYLKNNQCDFELIGIEYCELLKADRNQNIYILIPYSPPEVWGVGVTYKKNRDIHEFDLKAIKSKYEGLYDFVYKSKRPEIFFKALAHHCVGTHEKFSIRKGSESTIVEAELACVYNKEGNILAYTIANDVTAWDIELECPLFLNYAKIFDGCCVIGPSMIPALEVVDPLALKVSCCMERNGKEVFSKSGNTSNMKRSLKELTENLTENRTISDGTVLCTGTAVGIPSYMNCIPNDIIKIEIENFGYLLNKAK